MKMSLSRMKSTYKYKRRPGRFMRCESKLFNLITVADTVNASRAGSFSLKHSQIKRSWLVYVWQLKCFQVPEHGCHETDFIKDRVLYPTRTISHQKRPNLHSYIPPTIFSYAVITRCHSVPLRYNIMRHLWCCTILNEVPIKKHGYIGCSACDSNPYLAVRRPTGNFQRTGKITRSALEDRKEAKLSVESSG